MTEQTKYLIEDIKEEDKPVVPLVGQSSESAAIIVRVMRAWKKKGRKDVAEEYRKRATSDDYTNLLYISTLYVREPDEEGVDWE